MEFAIVLVFLTLPLSSLGARPPDERDLERIWKRYLEKEAGRRPAMRFPFETCFRSAAREYKLPLSLLLAVTRGESDFNPRAKSDRNCYGLMQIQWPGTAGHLGIKRLADLYNPCINIRAGARYLRELLDRYQGNLHLALAAYNYGPSRIPVNAGPNSIPEGARWYSGYILHHLGYVMGRTTTAPTRLKPGQRPFYKGEGKLEIIVFNRPYRARGFMVYVRSRAPSLRLDWFRTGLGRFHVVMLYGDIKELEMGRKVLQNLRLSVR